MRDRLAASAKIRSVARISTLAIVLFGSPALSQTSQRLPVVVDVGRDSKIEFAVFSMPEILWKCEGKRCLGTVEPRPVSAMNACKGVARKMNRVIAFKVADRPFDDTQLLACNGGRTATPTE